MDRIATLFSRPVGERIEEVIKVDDDDQARVREELSEYVVTASIKKQQIAVLEAYLEATRKPHDGTAVWVSGFFGSGKSSFAKMLGVALEDRALGTDRAGALLANRIGDTKADVLLRQVNEIARTEAVIFDVSTDRGIRAGNQSITEIMYRLLLQKLGYARELDMAELEITLEGEGRLDVFKAKYAEMHGKQWDRDKGLPVLAIGRASAVMHALEPQTYNAPDSWVKGAQGRGDVTPGLLAERCLTLLGRRRPDKRNLLFVIDEMGQFVARDSGRLEELRAVVERLGQRGAGRIWVMVTSQEALKELMSGLDDTLIELPKVRDRFPLQVHLEPADISEVTGRRVLAKTAAAEARLRELFTAWRARLSSYTQVHTPNIKLPELTAERFIELYPLLPYQVDLIINVVSGLRTQAGASRHVGGANRTIIKLAQQVLVHPDVDLANKPIGTLVTLDQVYDLVAGNVQSDIRQKIDEVAKKVDHKLAAAVAKAICLLQYVKSVPRTAENLAATLHPAVDAESRLPEVREALARLVKARSVREGEDGYRIPTPAEDDWETQRAALSPKPADVMRIHSEVVAGLFDPQPSHVLMDVKPFKAGLLFNNKLLLEGDVPVHIALTTDDAEHTRVRDEWRARSQAEPKALFWAARLDRGVTAATDEVFRSNEILARKDRDSTTRDASALVAEEKRRQRRSIDELRRLVRESLLAGTLLFRGNDRSPDAAHGDVARAVSRALSIALPEVFHRFHEAAARVGTKDLEALLTTENLRGLPAVFAQLSLVREEKGKPVFRVDNGPLAEVLSRVADRHRYGETLSGRAVTDWFAREPYGWDFDVVRLFVLCLLRAGAIEAISKGQVLDNALSLEARSTFPNNNLFKQATFRPKETLDFAKVVEAYQRFQDVFGKEVGEIEQGVVARAIKDEVAKQEERLRDVHTTLLTHTLPGAAVLAEAIDGARTVRGGSDENAILTFLGSWAELKEAIQRAAELADALTEPRLMDLARARDVLRRQWAFLATEPDLPAGLSDRAGALADRIAKETFFRELPYIDQDARVIADEHGRRFVAAVDARTAAYRAAVDRLHRTPGWEDLTGDQQARVAAPLTGPLATSPPPTTPIPQVRAETEACAARLARAVEEMLRMVDGNRVVQVRVGRYFVGGIETPEALDAAIAALREECERHIGAGKKILVQ
jgi:hypothetical protein